jgi:polygalacturonase/pectin methylesterase-like acyl-CoA thioesterase
MKAKFRPSRRAAAKSILFLLAFALVLAGEPLAAQTNLVVAQDGSGQFKTVQEAIMAVPLGSSNSPVVIHIKPGIYKELIYVQREKSFFKLVGENPTNTILTFNLYAGITNTEGKPIGTFKTPSTTIDADDFTAENLTFENSAGPVGQALAIRVDGDRAVFRNCRFLGWQDTILLNRGRQYFENCYVCGHVDFIFGAATAWFEKCEIHSLRDGYLTAASTPVDVPFGFVFSNCKITGEPGVKTYLGRPWRIYASTIYLNCEMSDAVRPEGWNDWKKPETHQTARYAEFNSTGSGANPQMRAAWAKQLTDAAAEQITVEKVLGGSDGWNPKEEKPVIPSPAESSVDAGTPQAWSQIPIILSRIVPPAFPGGELVVTNHGLRAGQRGTVGTFYQSHDFAITDFGAVGDGAADCTRAFADAIIACKESGGGRVVVPAGKFLTGPIHLLSNVNLHVVKDATVLFTTNTAAYLPVVFTRYESTEVMNYSPLIYAFGQKNIAITGEGTLDSQATNGVWHSWSRKGEGAKLVEMGNNDVPVRDRVFGAGHFLRPYFIQPTRCRNILIEGVKILGSPMWVVSPLYCTNVTVRGVTVEATGPNTDGCDPDSCTDVLIKDCSFSDGDDCIAIKSGRDRDGHRVNIPSRNLVIQNCQFKAGHGGVSAGSETSGGVENVFAEDCIFNSPDLDYAFRFKTNPARGGYIRNVFIRNCKVQTARFGIHMTLRYGGAGALEGPYTPEMGNIDIRDCTFANLTRQPIFIEGYDEKIKITGVTVANCTFHNAADQNTVTNASDIHLLGNRWGATMPQ